jgi:hypothetical protein
LEKVLRRGMMPLSIASDRYIQQRMGLPPEMSGRVAAWLLQLREADLSVFKDRRRFIHGRAIPRPQAWEAETGSLGAGSRPALDDRAASGRAVESIKVPDAPAVVTYKFAVSVAGSYNLWCRLRPVGVGDRVSVCVDNHARREIALPGSPNYLTQAVLQNLDLGDGPHSLTIQLLQAGTRLDLVELTPCPPQPGVASGASAHAVR